MTTAPPDFSVALHYFEQAKSMIDAFREFPDFEVCFSTGNVFFTFCSHCCVSFLFLFFSGRSNG